MLLTVNLKLASLSLKQGAGDACKGAPTMTVDAHEPVMGSIGPDGYQPSVAEMLLLRGVCHDVAQELAVIQVLGGLVARAAADIRLRSRASCRAVGRPVQLLADVVLLRRAVINLLDNAVRAAGPAGVVVAWVQPSRAGAVIQVDDSGPGLGNAPRGRASLGLGIVRECADAHRGSLVFGTSPLGGAR